MAWRESEHARCASCLLPSLQSHSTSGLLTLTCVRQQATESHSRSYRLPLTSSPPCFQKPKSSFQSCPSFVWREYFVFVGQRGHQHVNSGPSKAKAETAASTVSRLSISLCVSCPSTITRPLVGLRYFLTFVALPSRGSVRAICLQIVLHQQQQLRSSFADPVARAHSDHHQQLRSAQTNVSARPARHQQLRAILRRPASAPQAPSDHQRALLSTARTSERRRPGFLIIGPLEALQAQ